MIKYFHELTKEEFDKLAESEMIWKTCAELYPQPEWCDYPDAVAGMMGCWSLMYHKIHSSVDCALCDCFKEYKSSEIGE